MTNYIEEKVEEFGKDEVHLEDRFPITRKVIKCSEDEFRTTLTEVDRRARVEMKDQIEQMRSSYLKGGIMTKTGRFRRVAKQRVTNDLNDLLKALTPPPLTN